MPGAVAACAAGPRDLVSPEEVAAAKYVHGAPYSITLLTMINNRTGGGAHSSIMINAPSQRVIFDPAGSVRHPRIVEREDVLYGVTPQIVDFYERAHARETYHVVIQNKPVPGEVAEQALRLAEAKGAAPQAFCSNYTSSILVQLPGFDSIRPTFFPKKLMEQYGALPGVTERKLFENDADDKQIAIDAFQG
ncbi:lipoprotein [Pseudaestuariivita atlantica]|uniref:Lipoprotein n=2 Tax=Pseudaestuariivita atlantica TaxID=1317121 RepID=A0A0L1JLT3_9RHOB|nr:lipoprotein [Pseudaestuariivita atlantica]